MLRISPWLILNIKPESCFLLSSLPNWCYEFPLMDIEGVFVSLRNRYKARAQKGREPAEPHCLIYVHLL